VLAGLAAGFGIGLLVGSTEATVGATLFGGVLVAAGTFRTIQVAREGQLTERFSKATEQLDAKDSDGKREQLLVLGGIYSLERIAAESRLDYYPIMEVLTAFVRASARLPEGAAIQDRVDPSPCQYKLPDDVQAALAVLARRNPRRGEYRLDLGSADLRNAKLPHARFGMAILSGSDLRCADLREADLRGAKLSKAHLESTDLTGADLDGAELEGTWIDTETKPEALRATPGVQFSR
jgi:hypothetical protein